MIVKMIRLIAKPSGLSEVGPLNPHGRQRELSPASCPLIPTHIVWYEPHPKRERDGSTE